MAFQLRWSGSGSWAACGPSNQGPRTSRSDECLPRAISEVFSLLPHADAKWVKSMRTTSWRQRIPPNYWGDQYFKIEIGLLNVNVSTRKILTACNQQSTFLWENLILPISCRYWVSHLSRALPTCRRAVASTSPSSDTQDCTAHISSIYTVHCLM